MNGLSAFGRQRVGRHRAQGSVGSAPAARRDVVHENQWWSLACVHNRDAATSSSCLSIMLTYSGSSGHTPKKPLMTLQLCNLNSLCSCSDCQEYCNPKSLLRNCKRETWAAADRHILTIRFLSRLAFRLIFYVNRTMVFPYRLLQYSKAIYFTRKLSTVLQYNGICNSAFIYVYLSE